MENYSYDIFDNVDERQKLYWVKNVPATLEFHNKICNDNAWTKLESIINMMLSFNLPLIDKELVKNKIAHKEVLKTEFNNKKS